MPVATRDESRSRYSEAVRLFLRCLADAKAPAPDPKGEELIERICVRLDGLPLAIQLAAAEAAKEGLSAVARELDNAAVQAPIPAGGRAAWTHTMDTSIRRSYDRLSETAQRLFRRSGVFVEGFDAAAAQRVCAGGELDSAEIPNLIKQLVTASLLNAEADGPRVRYRYLEVIRQFAAALLAPNSSVWPAQVPDREPEEQAVRLKHAQWCVELVTFEGTRLTTRDQLAALRRLECEYANLHAALHWTREQKQTTMVLQLASHLRHYYWMRAHYFTGCQVMDLALAQFAAEAMPSRELQSLAADVLCGSAMLSMERNEFEDAKRAITRSVRLHRVLRDHAALGRSLSIAGRLAYAREAYLKALDLLGKSLTLRDAACDDHGRAVTLKHRGTAHYYLGQLAKAADDLIESLAIFDALGDMTWCGYALINLANVQSTAGNFAAADLLYLESLAIRWVLGARGGIDFVSGRPGSECRESWSIRPRGVDRWC